MRIIPAILPQRYRDIEYAVSRVYGSADTIQIDFVDGHFAPNKTWLFNGRDEEVIGEFEREERGLPHWQELNYELDLMVRDPLPLMDRFFMLGPSRIILHAESLDQERTLAYLAALPEIIRSTIRFSMAIGAYTDPEAIRPYLPHISGIQCMGIASIGYQGQPFDERAVEQVSRLRALYPELPVSVDGAVSEENIGRLAAAGATSFAIGSALFGNDDPRGTMKRLIRLCSTADDTASPSSN